MYKKNNAKLLIIRSLNKTHRASLPYTNCKLLMIKHKSRLFLKKTYKNALSCNYSGH